MNEIVIEVRGGTVTDVFSDIEDARIVIVDWDLIAQGDGQGRAGYLHEHSKLERLQQNTEKEYRQLVSEVV